MENDGTVRALTEEEWKLWVRNAPYVDLHDDSPYDFNYQGRREFYPDANAQLGAIWKALDAIEQSGVDIGTSASAMLAKIKAIKVKYPKPVNLISIARIITLNLMMLPTEKILESLDLYVL